MFKVNNKYIRTTSSIAESEQVNVSMVKPLENMIKVKNKDIKSVLTGCCTATIVILNKIAIFGFGANLFSLLSN